MIHSYGGTLTCALAVSSTVAYKFSLAIGAVAVDVFSLGVGCRCRWVNGSPGGER